MKVNRKKMKQIERTRVMYSLLEIVWRSSKSIIWSCRSFWTNSTTFRFENRTLDLTCSVNSNCRYSLSSSPSMDWSSRTLRMRFSFALGNHRHVYYAKNLKKITTKKWV